MTEEESEDSDPGGTCVLRVTYRERPFGFEVPFLRSIGPSNRECDGNTTVDCGVPKVLSSVGIGKEIGDGKL